MKIAIDISPLKDSRIMGHRVRGTGFYLENLKNSLLKYFTENDYIFFSRSEKLPKEIDIIHYPYFEPFFLTLPFIKRYKTIVTVHDLTPLVFSAYFPIGIKGKIKWNIQKLILKKSNAIITDSLNSKKDIEKFAGIDKDKIHVAYLAAGENFRKMEDGRWKMEVKKKFNLPDHFLLYVGDVTWNKNLPRLVEASILAKLPLAMVGKSLLEKNFDKGNPWNQDLVKVQELAEKNENIYHLGFVEDNELVALYNLADALLMPSLYEGFGLPILEAMQCGCPVITAKTGSIPEVAGEAALYVDPYNIKDIEAGIKRVFSRPEIREELSQKGFIQAKKFSWKKTASDTLAVYKEVVGS